MYAVSATVEFKTEDGWHGSRQVPTFYLGSRIRSEEAAQKEAEQIINPLQCSKIKVHVSAVKI